MSQSVHGQTDGRDPPYLLASRLAAEHTDGKLAGLGIEVTMENGVVKVVSPIKGGPAERAGIQTNNLITHLDNEKILDMTLEQVVEKMRGPVNTPVKLTVIRKESQAPRHYDRP